ncbi:YciI family protein [Christiangramia sp.]|uniref:YciI family protein n=1 Tax=Christiangramia sp. TaxID=1931228 RepID=UPI002602595A|nr:YciI family protein [Christiangramia sp.]
MRKLLFSMILGLGLACTDNPKNLSEPEKAGTKDTLGGKKHEMPDIETGLKEKGYKTFSYKEGDTTYLMQQYYMVFLKAGPNRSQGSTEAAELQKSHMAYLERLSVEGYTSLTGPMGDDGDLRGIVVFNTATQKEADSLAKLDPMVKAGRLKVEVHPWWVAKGSKLN